jgi:hypothetical protein
LLRELTSVLDVKPRSGVLKLKKRHVEEVTRLPTNVWQLLVGLSL